MLVARRLDEAVALARDEKIDMLITDVIMPTHSGRDFAEAVLAVRPQIPVLYVSGYPADVLAGREVAATGASFLPKPFTGAVIAARVRAILDESRI